MAIVERSTNRLIVETAGALGAFNLALDKQAGTARIERKTLMWKRRPREIPLADIKDFSVASLKDAASGAELRKLSMRTQAGRGDRTAGRGGGHRRNRVGLARFPRAGGLKAGIAR